ncbi:mitochondrial genome maintenance exonuclease 1-like [Rhopalosiphum padi]|uniref:mitochondrial genome maintenance exonuclease 1-like n=1 Tax=Rhopalosiphum padi TaxID=40932 RepID=UPI00298DEAF9|nr:mitochondrial genome maintenance exonuclease 1-like [Rhopalosiphum padi]XP_060835699.1 mitochondrial genome maintenance exonuclease 1-like [Rhopalosiphum padi]
MIGIRSSLRFKTTDCKKSLGTVFKQMNKDTKQLFGDLLETNKTRKHRMKLAEKIVGDEKEKENNYLNRLKSKIKPTAEDSINSMVNDSKQNLNQEYYEKLTVEIPSEMIIHETPKRDLPSVTNILNTTMSEKSKAALENWKKSMIEKLGEDGFNKYSRELMAMGSAMHSKIRSHLTGCPPDVSHYEEVENCWKSLDAVIKNVSKPILVEKMVVHDGLSYKGIVDCVAFYKNTPVVIEWKKSSRDKSSLQATYDAPIQLAAYMGAVNNDISYDFKVEEGLVVVAYSDGHPANVFKLTKQACLDYWTIWVKRLNKYKQIQSSFK